jgi:hypothetical protein
MAAEKRSSIIGGIILILVGGVFLALQFFPEWAAQFNMSRQWPLLVVGAGIIFFIAAVLGTKPLVIPGSIITGIGGILYYQNLTGNWASWAYIWALIPGFAGVGNVLLGMMSKEERYAFRYGWRLIGFSVVAFVVFGALFGGFGKWGDYWPVLLIGYGLWLLVRSFLRR